MEYFFNFEVAFGIIPTFEIFLYQIVTINERNNVQFHELTLPFLPLLIGKFYRLLILINCLTGSNIFSTQLFNSVKEFYCRGTHSKPMRYETHFMKKERLFFKFRCCLCFACRVACLSLTIFINK